MRQAIGPIQEGEEKNIGHVLVASVFMLGEGKEKGLKLMRSRDRTRGRRVVNGSLELFNSGESNTHGTDL